MLPPQQQFSRGFFQALHMVRTCNKILVPRKCAHACNDILDHCLKSAVDRNCALAKSSKVNVNKNIT